MHIWCQLIPQTCLVLNFLWQSRIKTKFLAYAQVHGTYVFNATPVAPPGTSTFVHEKPAVCGSWEIWGIDGWYLGQALHHYRCLEVFTNNTLHIWISDTVEFSRINLPWIFHHQQTMLLNQQNNFHILYSIQNQVHHSTSLEIPPWLP